MNGRTVGKGVAYAAVVVAAVAGVAYVTRSESAGATTAAAKGGEADHSMHGAGPATGQATPVRVTPDEARRIGVTYATAERGPLTREVRTVGQVTFDETRIASIAAKVDGYVEHVTVNATGQRVTEGQPLLTLYSPMLVAAQEELLLAKRLADDVSRGTDEAKRGAQDMLESTRRRLAYWDIAASQIAEIERSGRVQKSITLRASAGGHVLEKRVLPGQRIMAGDALYKVADLSTVWVEGDVFEQDLPAVRVGEMVRADFEAMPGAPRTGRISYVYPTLNPETRTARVRVVLPNGDLRLKPGMYATLCITGSALGNVLTVPREAVLSTGTRHVVFVRETGGALTPREVVLGVTSGDRAEVLRGLAAGESVVSSATFLIDAESNLGKALGGMGDMPGMDVTRPPTSVTPAPPAPDHKHP